MPKARGLSQDRLAGATLEAGQEWVLPTTPHTHTHTHTGRQAEKGEDTLAQTPLTLVHCSGQCPLSRAPSLPVGMSFKPVHPQTGSDNKVPKAEGQSPRSISQPWVDLGGLGGLNSAPCQGPSRACPSYATSLGTCPQPLTFNGSFSEASPVGSLPRALRSLRSTVEYPSWGGDMRRTLRDRHGRSRSPSQPRHRGPLGQGALGDNPHLACPSTVLEA